MDAARLTALIRYCHLTEFAEDEEVKADLSAFYNAAIQYMDNAGVPQPSKPNPLYDLCVNSLVLQWYDNMRRNTGADGNTDDGTEPPGFRRILNQLKVTSINVSDSDTFIGEGG